MRDKVKNRDFKIWYGEAVVRRQIVKITSGDVMWRADVELSKKKKNKQAKR